MSPLRDRVWLTARIRMRSEARLRSFSRFLNFSIFWYSTALTILTVYQLIAPKDQFRDITSAALAILVFGLSIFIPTLNLEKDAERFRECYLKLQRILDIFEDEKELKKEYYETLDAYPNHPEKDYVDFVVSSKIYGQELEHEGKPRNPTIAMWAGFATRALIRYVGRIMAIIAPALLYFLL